MAGCPSPALRAALQAAGRPERFFTGSVPERVRCLFACRKKRPCRERGILLNRERQKRAPIYEALEKFRKMRVVPFDVPGHKRGRGNPELAALLGETCVQMDVNSMKPLDNLCHPVSVIKEAEELTAAAFHAAHAFLMVGGTTSAVQSMVLSVVRRGEKIILPRNVHRSVIGALVLCGAVPVYVNPACEERLGIPLGMCVADVEQAIRENPETGSRSWNVLSGRRSPRNTFLFWRESSCFCHGCRGGYGSGFHAQIRRKPDPEFCSACRSPDACGIYPPDH